MPACPTDASVTSRTLRQIARKSSTCRLEQRVAVLVSSTEIKYKDVCHKRLYNMAVQNPSIHFSVTIVGALIGVVILFFGRKLFWLCVAAIGFAAGVEIAPHLVHEPSPLLSLTIALSSWLNWSVARAVPAENCDCCARFSRRRQTRRRNRRRIFRSLRATLDLHFSGWRNHRRDSPARFI